MNLSDDEVLHILKLIDESKFDYFQLEMGDLKITVSKGEPPSQSAPQSASAPQTVKVSTPDASTQAEPAKPAPKPAAIPDGLVPITAPLLGTFYVAPEPGAAPFVTVGAAVTEDTTVGLIEVMKVFSSVRAGVKGTVVEIVAQNGQFIEYGQTLILVKP